MRYEIRTDLGTKLDHAPTLAAALTAATRYGGVVYDSKTGKTQCRDCGRFTCNC